MFRILVLLTLLWSSASPACSAAQRYACARISQLVADRAAAITASFGDLAPIMPSQMDIRFMRFNSPESRRFSRNVGYDLEQGTLFLPRRLADEAVPGSEQARDYWSFYESPELRITYPVIAQIDAALWDVYLQEAAQRSGLSWPPADCLASESERRLPCEMVAGGVAEYVSRPKPRLFNANRIELIWPENYAEFSNRLWRRDDRSVADVKRYGGLMLLQPLVEKFGVPWALAYIAQQPFRVENNNLRESALRFQERALGSMM